MNNKNFAVALTKCYFCGGDSQILINSRLTPRDASNVEKAHQKIINMEPCDKCSEFMKKGIILLTIDSAKSGENWNKHDGSDYLMPDPHRMGGFIVLTENGLRHLCLPPEMEQWAFKKRWMFIEHETAEQIGLLKFVKE